LAEVVPVIVKVISKPINAYLRNRTRLPIRGLSQN
jgi:hypothetical protein